MSFTRAPFWYFTSLFHSTQTLPCHSSTMHVVIAARVTAIPRRSAHLACNSAAMAPSRRVRLARCHCSSFLHIKTPLLHCVRHSCRSSSLCLCRTHDLRVTSFEAVLLAGELVHRTPTPQHVTIVRIRVANVLYLRTQAPK